MQTNSPYCTFSVCFANQEPILKRYISVKDKGKGDALKKGISACTVNRIALYGLLMTCFLGGIFEEVMSEQ